MASQIRYSIWVNVDDEAGDVSYAQIGEIREDIYGILDNHYEADVVFESVYPS